MHKVDKAFDILRIIKSIRDLKTMTRDKLNLTHRDLYRYRFDKNNCLNIDESTDDKSLIDSDDDCSQYSFCASDYNPETIQLEGGSVGMEVNDQLDAELSKNIEMQTFKNDFEPLGAGW
jgi:hypothetical protein